MGRSVAPLVAAGVALVALRCGSSDGGVARPPADAGSGGDAASVTEAGWDSAGAAGSNAGAGGAAGSAGTAGDGGLGPPPGNALLRSDGTVVPLYAVPFSVMGTRAIGVVQSGTTLTVVDEDGAPLWTKDVGEGSLFGGFDYDGDGVVDAALVRSKDSGSICGSDAMLDTWIDVVDGKTGVVMSLLSPQPAKCWTFSTATYPTVQWTGLGVLFGAGKALSLQAYYATDGSFVQHAAGSFATLGQYDYPSTAAYDQSYAAAKPNAWGQGTSFLANSHVANGLVTNVSGSERVVFFTSGRVVQYAVAPKSSAQLVVDTPYLTGNRTDLAGRNYGLVVIDPADATKLALIAGTDTVTVHDDMLASKMQSDPWGQIERHVTRYDLPTGAVVDRFFSYAHDNNDGNQYQGRVVYPAGAWVRRSGPSRLAFNVYEGGHWVLHVTEPGGVDDATTFKDLFLWDIADLDGDGSDEWVITPSRDPNEPDVPGYYFVKWRTQLASFDDATLKLAVTAQIDGAIPYLVGRFREPTRTTSRGALYPALTARTAAGLQLLLRKPDGSATTHAL